MSAEAEAELRCARCGCRVRGTRHTRNGYTVGYFMLHTGSGVATVHKRAEDDPGFAYERLVDQVDVVSCPRCFGLPEVRRLWSTWGKLTEAACG